MISMSDRAIAVYKGSGTRMAADVFVPQASSILCVRRWQGWTSLRGRRHQVRARKSCRIACGQPEEDMGLRAWWGSVIAA